MLKKGVIITLEAIFALLAAATIIFSALFYTSSVSMTPYNTQALNRLSQDSLTVLEKQGVLREAIETGSVDNIELFLNSLPSHACAKIDLKDKNHNVLNSAIRSGCPEALESVHERRAFTSNFTVYYAKMESWYNATLPGGSI